MGERISYLAKSSMTTTSTKVFTPCVNDKSKEIKDYTNNNGWNMGLSLTHFLTLKIHN
jgi:hypothetical protein